MRTYEDPDSGDYNPAAVEADRALGRRAAEIVLDQHFPDFRELAHTGVGCYEPHLIYRDGDSFLIVDTEVGGEEEEVGVWARELPDGRVAERGSREYLSAGIEDLGQRSEAGRALADALQSALAANRVRHVLVSVRLAGAPGEQKVESVELTEFNL
jgi:hypothetical protein